MEKEGKKVFVMYLTNWQRRMVKDFLGVDCHCWEVPIDGMAILYGVRIPKDVKVKRMYLTNWQIREMKDETGHACNFIELEQGRSKLLYKVPPRPPRID